MLGGDAVCDKYYHKTEINSMEKFQSRNSLVSGL